METSISIYTHTYAQVYHEIKIWTNKNISNIYIDFVQRLNKKYVYTTNTKKLVINIYMSSSYENLYIFTSNNKNISNIYI